MSSCKLMDSFKEPGFAEKYKRIAEGITSKYAVDILKQAGLDKGGHGRLVFLDSACGTGIVSAKLIEMLSPVEKGNLELTCGDFAEPMVEFVRNRMQKEGWKNAKAEVIDINKTGLPDNKFTHVIINFGVMLVEDPDALFQEIRRVLAPGGTIGIGTWETLSWYPFLCETIKSFPEVPPPPTEREFMKEWGKGHWEETAWVENEFKKHGFADVKVEVVENTSVHDSIEAFMEGMRLPITQFTGTYWNEEQREKYTPKIEPTMKNILTDRFGEGAKIEMVWRAILSTGRKPNA